MGKIIAIVSGKGGTGKTTATGALGSCMAAMGKKVLCIDCDMGLRNLDIVLGLSSHAVSDLSHLFGGMSVEEACIEHPKINGLYFLGAMPTYTNEYDADTASDVFETLREKFDYILIDAPAGISDGFRFAASRADTAVIVATGDASSMRDGGTVGMELRKLGIKDIKLLVNMVEPEIYKKVGTTVDNVIDTIGAQLIGIVRTDKNVRLAANFETPLVLYSRGRAAQGFLRTARRLCGEEIPLSI